MPEIEHILISVESYYAERMLDGSKTVELRRRPIRIKEGSKLWVYSKLPRGQIELQAEVKKVAVGNPIAIWGKYGNRTGISRKEYFAYFNGAETAYAILIDCVNKLPPILSLVQIRRKAAHFHPPQFYKRLKLNSPELKYLMSALS